MNLSRKQSQRLSRLINSLTVWNIVLRGALAEPATAESNATARRARENETDAENALHAEFGVTFPHRDDLKAAA